MSTTESRADFLKSERKWLETEGRKIVEEHRPSWERSNLRALLSQDIALIDRELSELTAGHDVVTPTNSASTKAA